jgi:hypothetical protein
MRTPSTTSNLQFDLLDEDFPEAMEEGLIAAAIAVADELQARGYSAEIAWFVADETIYGALDRLEGRS